MSKDKEIFDELDGLVLQEAKKQYSPKVIHHFMNPRNIGALEEPDCYTYMSGICGYNMGNE